MNVFEDENQAKDYVENTYGTPLWESRLFKVHQYNIFS